MTRFPRVAHAAFTSALRDVCGIPDDVSRNFLFVTSAFRDLFAGDKVLERITMLEVAAMRHRTDWVEETELRSIFVLARSAIAHRKLLEQRFRGYWGLKPKIPGTNPLRGLALTISPIWAACCERHVDPDADEVVQELLALCLVGNVALANQYADRARYASFVADGSNQDLLGQASSSASNAGLALRRLTKLHQIEAMSNFRQCLAEATESSSTRLVKLSEAVSRSPPDLAECLQAIVAFLRLAEGARGVRRRQERTSITDDPDQPARLMIKGQSMISAFKDRGAFGQTIFLGHQSPESVAELDPPSVSFLQVPLVVTSEKYVKRLYTEQGMRNHLDRSSVSVPFHEKDLSLGEIRRLGFTFFGTHACSSQDSPTRILGAICLYLGRDLKVCRMLRITTSREPARYALEYLADISAFRVLVPPPDLVDPEKYSGPGYQPTKPYICIPDRIGFGCLLSKFPGTKDSEGTVAPFLGIAESDFKHQLEQLMNNSVGNPLTASALPLAIRQTVLHQSDDPVLVRMLTAFSTDCANVRAHYTCEPARLVESAHESACRKLWPGLLTHPIALHASFNAHHVGAPHVPTREAIRERIKALQNPRPSREQRQLHTEVGTAFAQNSFVTHTVAALTLAGAIRAVEDPRPLAIGKTVAFATYLHKDDGTSYHRYTVPVGRVAGSIWNEYLMHLETAGRFLGGSTEDMFFLLKDGKKIPFAPRHVEGHGDFLEVLRGFRRYFCSHLTTSGASAQLIEAAMGHSSGGREPYSAVSSLCLAQLETLFHDYVEPMLEDLDVRLVRSPLVGNNRG